MIVTQCSELLSARTLKKVMNWSPGPSFDCSSPGIIAQLLLQHAGLSVPPWYHPDPSEPPPHLVVLRTTLGSHIFPANCQASCPSVICPVPRLQLTEAVIQSPSQMIQKKKTRPRVVIAEEAFTLAVPTICP